jgi:hypothetical protein
MNEDSMKNLMLVLLSFTSFSINALASEAREVICSVPQEVDGVYTVQTSSACTDYVEVAQGVFAKNTSACFQVTSRHALLVDGFEMLAAVKDLANGRKPMCFIGAYSAITRELAVQEIVEESALPIE